MDVAQKGNRDIEDPLAAFSCGFQLKTPADLFKEGMTLLVVLGGYHLSGNAIKGTASDAEEAHLHNIDGSAGDLKQRMTGYIYHCRPRHIGCWDRKNVEFPKKVKKSLPSPLDVLLKAINVFIAEQSGKQVPLLLRKGIQKVGDQGFMITFQLEMQNSLA